MKRIRTQTLTTSHHLGGRDLDDIHAWLQRGHDAALAKRSNPSYPSGNHAAFPAERDEQ